MRHPSTARKLLPHEYRIKDLTPRVRLAARFYATGMAKTKAEAARMAGMAPATFYLISTTETRVSDYINEIDRELSAGHIKMGDLLQRLGRRAVRNIAATMENELVKPEVRLKAAQDLADRSPETSKVININAHVQSPISDAQFDLMRKAMLEAAEVRQRYSHVADGNYVTASDEATARGLQLVSDNNPKALPSGEVPTEEVA